MLDELFRMTDNNTLNKCVGVGNGVREQQYAQLPVEVARKSIMLNNLWWQQGTALSLEASGGGGVQQKAQ